ncbi:MAG TPA: VTT domain-containing protein [Cellulomonas sp.]
MTDVAAAYGMTGWPFWAVIGALFVIVLGRSHLIYWLGRGAFSGAAALAGQIARGHEPHQPEVPAQHRHRQEHDAPEPVPPAGTAGLGTAPGGRLHRLLSTRTARRGLRLVHRWGPAAVTLAYLTVGLQTAVFAGAGLLRMPYLRFTIASVPGSIAWAFVWGTVGLGALWAAVTLATRSPWALAGALLALLALAGWLVARRRTRRAVGPEDAGAEPRPVEADEPAVR